MLDQDFHRSCCQQITISLEYVSVPLAKSQLPIQMIKPGSLESVIEIDGFQSSTGPEPFLVHSIDCLSFSSGFAVRPYRDIMNYGFRIGNFRVRKRPLSVMLK